MNLFYQKLLGILLLSILYSKIFSQNKSASDSIFSDNDIPKINVIIEQDSLDILLESGNAESNHEYPVIVIYESSLIYDTIENVGFRLRGNTSRFAKKKSFKLSFNTFIQGRKFYGLEKMNINGEHNDPSVIRSKLCWNILEKFDVYGSRANYVEFYINSLYRGLYINVEHIDEEFVNKRYGNKDGNLYKCLWPATLEYLGSDPNLYKFTSGNRRAYDLKTNTVADDYSDLAEFIDVLNNTPINDLAQQIENIFNVESYLKNLVVEIFVGQWDGYSYNKNNFYLYKNTSSGKFEFIHYDMDNTFGIDWMGVDWGNRDIYNWAADNEARPLVDRILEVPEYLQQFSLYMNQLKNSIVAPNIIFPQIDAIKTTISPYIENDSFYTLDYGWNINDFINSYTQELSANHVTYGLKPYISERNNSIIEQLDLPESLIVINEIMASNQTTFADEFGEFDDWVEIYNPTNQAIFLGDKYLSDNPENPQKWQMPQIYIQPDNFLIFWADKDSLQGEMHTNFKLDKAGEKIGIYYQSGTKYLPLDFVVFETQTEDISFGRFPNGSGSFYKMQNPTPENYNLYTNIFEVDRTINFSSLSIFPNPFYSEINLNFDFDEAYFVELQIFNSNGKLVSSQCDFMKSKQKHFLWNARDLNNRKINSGVYFVKIKAFTSDNIVAFYESAKIVYIR